MKCTALETSIHSALAYERPLSELQPVQKPGGVVRVTVLSLLEILW